MVHRIDLAARGLLALVLASGLTACVFDDDIGDGQRDIEGKHLPPGFFITPQEEMTIKPPATADDVLAKLNQPPLVWESALGTGLLQRDDDCDYRSFGFSFEFYGTAYTGVWINSNGNITFGGCNRDWWHPDIPDGGRRVIGPLYGDFNPSWAGDVYVNKLGTTPNRRFVVTWSGVPEYSHGGRNSFQLQLFEGSNHILFGYNGLDTDGINWAWSAPSRDARMDVGISSGTGAYINSASGSAIPALDHTNICYVPVAGSYQERRGQCVIQVDIDIKPGGEPNSINCHNERGVIPVAILSTGEFDATTVDHSTVEFESALETHVDRNTGDPRRHEEDVDGDGDTDLVLHFRMGDTSLTCDSITGRLTGETFDGQPIEGSDSVRMIDRP